LTSRPLRIGTRGSPMALRQTVSVRDRLIAANPSELAEMGAIQIVTVSTTGDRVQNRLLAEIGGKGLFAKEIEEALLAGDIDLAVHSLKDLETWLPDGLAIACVLPRDDPRDAFISASGASLASLPRGATIGTASLRRQAQLLRYRPDLSIVPIRGNVNTRIRKRGPAKSTGWFWPFAISNGSTSAGMRRRSCPSGLCCRRSVKARSLLSAGRPTR
jgi:hydroxymethylbilane synthase